MTTQKIEISTKTLFNFFLIILAALFCYYFTAVIIVLFLSVIISAVVDKFVSFFKKYHIPKALTIVAFYIIALSFVFFCFYQFLPMLINNLLSFLRNLPIFLNSFKEAHDSGLWYGKFYSFIADSLSNINVGNIDSKITNWIYAFSLNSGGKALNYLVYTALTIIISFYLSFTENGLQSFLRLITPKKHEDYITDLSKRVERNVSRWFFGQVIVASIVSLLVYIVLISFSIPFALPITIIAFLFELIPVLGVISAGIPAVFLAYNLGGLSLALVIFICLFLISQISSYILYPKIVGKFLGVPNVIIIIAVFIGAEVGGFIGALISLPVVSLILELIEDHNLLKKEKK